MSRVEKEIPLSYKFNLPAVIDTVCYGGKILEIAREEGNWIVLDNHLQQHFFDLLRKCSIEEALAVSNCSDEDVNVVVMQLVARHFEKRVRYQRLSPIMQLYLTNGCNMHCPHCYMYAGNKLDSEMTTDEVKSVLNAYRKSGGMDVKLTGGEIALRKDLIDIIVYGDSIGLRIDLLTNGTLWKKSMIEKVVPHINSVQISIDGYNEVENAKVRGIGNFEKALRAVDTFVHCGAIVKVAITANYSPDINNKVEEFANFAKELKQKYRDYKFDVDVATGLLPGRYGKLSERETVEYEQATLEINNRYIECSDVRNAAYIKRHRSGIVLTNCSYGYPTIAANGDVHFCPVTAMTQPIANIRTMPLDEIMDMCKRAHEMSETKNLEPCNHCELKAICGGDCRLNFRDLKLANVMNVKAPRRECNSQIKEKFYDIMIQPNEAIFH